MKLHQEGVFRLGLHLHFWVFLVVIFFFLSFPVSAFGATAHLEEHASEFINKTQSMYGEMVKTAALLHDVDPKLVLAVIVVESEGNEKVISRRGAQGLMQLMPRTARAMGAKNPKEPLQNILAGTKYLKELENDSDFGTPQEVLVAYNMGPNAAKRWLLDHRVEEYRYAANVTYVYHLLEGRELEKKQVVQAGEKKLAVEVAPPLAQLLITHPRTLSLVAFPMTIPSGRRNEIHFEN